MFTKRDKGNEIFLPFVPSSDSCDSQSWARYESPVWVEGAHGLGSSSFVFPGAFVGKRVGSGAAHTAAGV